MKVSAMRRNGLTLALGAVAAAACGGGDKANTDTAAAVGDSAALATPAPLPTPAAPAMTDPQIVSMIGLSNAAEIQAGTTAQRRATNAQVRTFAADMVREHRAMQRSSDSLTKAVPTLVAQAPGGTGTDTARAGAAGTTGTGNPADSARAAMKAASDSLTAAPRGAQFDQLYMAQQVAAHQKTLNDLNSFSTMAQDANLRTLIQGAIPKVQQHLDRARQVQSALGTGGTAGTGAAGDTTKAAGDTTKRP